MSQLRSDVGNTSGKRSFASRLPAVCDFSITNVCNAACDFCGFARDKALVRASAYADAGRFAEALPILLRRGIRYVTLQGGEPLVHPDILRLVGRISEAGMNCAVITNGWFLPRYVRGLAAAGLDRLEISGHFGASRRDSKPCSATRTMTTDDWVMRMRPVAARTRAAWA